jgi:hypothetical protein
VTGLLSDAAVWRLVHYCRRMLRVPQEYVERPYGDEQHRSMRLVAFPHAELRAVVWNDVEVRDALLATGFARDRFEVLRALVEERAEGSAFGLLYLMPAVELEAERRAARP